VPDAPGVIAIGLDAADPVLVRDLIGRGELPALAALAREGEMGTVRGRGELSSGCVWPTFFTGLEPEQHGMYSGGFGWRPDTMRVAARATQGWLEPFWSAAGSNGTGVGVLDVPFAPMVGLERGFEVSEWGAHDRIVGSTRVAPAGLRKAVDARHPFSSSGLHPRDADTRVDPAVLVASCQKGAERRLELAERLLDRARPDLAMITFPEIHHAAHDLWHTVEPAHPLYADLRQGDGPDLVDVYRAVDSAVGRLIERAGSTGAVMVFSLHGMRPARGVVTLLQPVLEALGYATPRAEGRRGALARAKQLAPARLKRSYQRRAPLGVRLSLAAATMVPPLDWSRTRAFSLASDQHGWLRMNVRGREAEGIVDRSCFGQVRADLVEALAALEDEEGRPLVREVVQLGEDDSPPLLLPDLVVHWTDAALADPVRVRGLDVEASPMARALTGQHRSEGFYLQRGLDLRGEVKGSELGARLLAAVPGR
jgi:predicted AlkP superfamily phosphohydrolase/phosphomutase